MKGLNIVRGQIVYEGVAAAFDLPFKQQTLVV